MTLTRHLLEITKHSMTKISFGNNKTLIFGNDNYNLATTIPWCIANSHALVPRSGATFYSQDGGARTALTTQTDDDALLTVGLLVVTFPVVVK